MEESFGSTDAPRAKHTHVIPYGELSPNQPDLITLVPPQQHKITAHIIPNDPEEESDPITQQEKKPTPIKPSCSHPPPLIHVIDRPTLIELEVKYITIDTLRKSIGFKNAESLIP
eukprot:8891893-Ditylum_brightwellii.AAC.1